MIKAKSITLARAEGPKAECHAVHLEFLRGIGQVAGSKEGRHGEFLEPLPDSAFGGLRNLWDAANKVLSGWAHSAPSGGAYDKCDFTVVFEDGNTYDGRYDLHRDEAADLANSVKGFLEFYAGLRKPADMTTSQYAEILLEAHDRVPGSKEAAASMLAKYDIGGNADEEETPTILVIKDGSRLCNDGKLRSFALFGNMPGCVKVYRFEGRARAAAARMGGQVVAVPPGMRIEAGGVVIETVPCDPPPGMSGKGVNYVRHIRHQLEEFVREPVRRELGSA